MFSSKKELSIQRLIDAKSQIVGFGELRVWMPRSVFISGKHFWHFHQAFGCNKKETLGKLEAVGWDPDERIEPFSFEKIIILDIQQNQNFLFFLACRVIERGAAAKTLSKFVFFVLGETN